MKLAFFSYEYIKFPDIVANVVSGIDFYCFHVPTGPLSQSKCRYLHFNEYKPTDSYDIIILVESISFFIQIPVVAKKIYLLIDKSNFINPNYRGIEMEGGSTLLLYNILDKIDGIFCRDLKHYLELTEKYYPYLKSKRNSVGNIFVEVMNNKQIETIIKRILRDIWYPQPESKIVELNPQPIKSYVINLKRRPDRYEKFLSLSKKYSSLQIERFEAVDGKYIESNIIKFNNTELNIDQIFSIDNSYINKKKNSYPVQKLTGGALGCALTHIELWTQIAEDKNNDNIYMILEDDVNFVINFEERFTELIKLLTDKSSKVPGWELCYLGFHDDIPYEDPSDTMLLESNLINIYQLNPKIKRSHGGGTFSYLIKPEGAKVLLGCVKKYKVCQPIDWFMIEMMNNITQLKIEPHLCISNLACHGADTDIQ